jgi:hypothetical protein
MNIQGHREGHGNIFHEYANGTVLAYHLRSIFCPLAYLVNIKSNRVLSSYNYVEMQFFIFLEQAGVPYFAASSYLRY